MRHTFPPPQIALLQARGRLDTHGVRLVTAADIPLAGQLLEKMRQHDNDDSPIDGAARLAGQEGVSRFFAQGHLLHWLVEGNDDLAGAIYYKRQPLLYRNAGKPPTASRTYTVEYMLRLYGGHANCGAAGAFMMASLIMRAEELYSCGMPLVEGLWARPHDGHRRSAQLFAAVGFSEARPQLPGVLLLPPTTIARLMGVGRG